MLEPCQGRGLDPFDGIEVVALSAASVKWQKVRRETFQRIFWRGEKSGLFLHNGLPSGINLQWTSVNYVGFAKWLSEIGF